jgi:hypothetical protein
MELQKISFSEKDNIIKNICFKINFSLILNLVAAHHPPLTTLASVASNSSIF